MQMAHVSASTSCSLFVVVVSAVGSVEAFRRVWLLRLAACSTSICVITGGTRGWVLDLRRSVRVDLLVVAERLPSSETIVGVAVGIVATTGRGRCE